MTKGRLTKIVNACFAVYGFTILCEISKVPFEFSQKILNPNTAKCTFYEVLKLTTYDILKLCLSETGPRGASNCITLLVEAITFMTRKPDVCTVVANC